MLKCMVTIIFPHFAPSLKKVFFFGAFFSAMNIEN